MTSLLGCAPKERVEPVFPGNPSDFVLAAVCDILWRHPQITQRRFEVLDQFIAGQDKRKIAGELSIGLDNPLLITLDNPLFDFRWKIDLTDT